MSYTVKSVTNNQYKLKVVNSAGALLVAPATVPTVAASSISDLSAYATTDAMLANSTAAYVNAVAYVDGKSFVNTSQLSSNLANYTPTSNLQLSTLNDVVANSLSDNATVVYQANNNKYVVKQLDLDGGSF